MENHTTKRGGSAMHYKDLNVSKNEVPLEEQIYGYFWNELPWLFVQWIQIHILKSTPVIDTNILLISDNCLLLTFCIR
jgi:hypothetical protein